MCHREHIDNQMKEKWEIVGTILVNNQDNPVYFFVKARFKCKLEPLRGTYRGPVGHGIA